jgi:hypothetical protein
MTTETDPVSDTLRIPKTQLNLSSSYAVKPRMFTVPGFGFSYVNTEFETGFKSNSIWTESSYFIYLAYIEDDFRESLIGHAAGSQPVTSREHWISRSSRLLNGVSFCRHRPSLIPQQHFMKASSLCRLLPSGVWRRVVRYILCEVLEKPSASIASLTGGDRSIGILRLRTKTTEFFFAVSIFRLRPPDLWQVFAGLLSV